jgi:hypothetical protein
MADSSEQLWSLTGIPNRRWECWEAGQPERYFVTVMNLLFTKISKQVICIPFNVSIEGI